MATTFKEIRKLQGERVRMRFDDGREVVAMLLCATKDMDGSRHLIYDKVEAGLPAQTEGDTNGCFYADARSVAHIEPADGKKIASTLHRRSPLAVRNETAKVSTGTWRPSA